GCSPGTAAGCPARARSRRPWSAPPSRPRALLPLARRSRPWRRCACARILHDLDREGDECPAALLVLAGLVVVVGSGVVGLDLGVAVADVLPPRILALIGLSLFAHGPVLPVAPRFSAPGRAGPLESGRARRRARRAARPRCRCPSARRRRAGRAHAPRGRRRSGRPPAPAAPGRRPR